MRQRLFLHVGTHKTGTTSIQQALLASRAELRAAGICYPFALAPFAASQTPQHQFAHALTHSAPGAELDAKVFAAGIRNDAAGAHTIVISSEPLYRHIDGMREEAPAAAAADRWQRRRTYLERLRALFASYDIEVLVYFREPLAFATSLFRERLRTGPYRGGRSAYLRDHALYFDYERQVALLREFFDVRVRKYETASAAGLVESFFSEIGAMPVTGAADTRARISEAPDELFRSDADRRRFERQHAGAIAFWAAIDPAT